VWGPHDPGVRIGYDQDYMNLAVWSQDKCRRCPCYCYDRFPVEKCPQGAEQRICEPLRTTNPGLILNKFEEIENNNVPVALTPQK